MSRNEAYGEWFHAGRQDGAARSAERVLPLVFDLVRPACVVDVGCGTGAWLAAAQRLGAETILGIDGGRVAEDARHIPPDGFLARDLAHPLRLDGRRFDLAVCMEVAQQLDPVRADSLVGDLCTLSDVVLFSAAIPGQTGTGHRNEQWPNYWRDRFGQWGYALVDCLRARLWDDPEIEPRYAQNAYLYVGADRLAADGRLRAAAAETGRMPLCVVHPGLPALSPKPFAPPVPAPPEQRRAPQRYLPHPR
ncbi:class I SAM-dependent methyltransferase [Streptomyces sp. NPDC051211]|uniref:class I SAM-dependent methyltransferase n=1 Tax=Streptomyces sp. NPDC051211 TaxID=3154643 RepID=UPI00344B01E1